MEYPFPISKAPLFDRIYAEQFNLNPSFNTLFPNIVFLQSPIKIAYHIGSSKENWNDDFEELVIFCSESAIAKVYLFWNLSSMIENEDYIVIDILKYNWKTLYPEPYDWDPVSRYSIGTHTGTSGSIDNTLLFLPPERPYQIFITNPQSFNLPAISNNRSQYIISEKHMRIYVHGPYVFNLARPGLGDKIKTYLQVATSLGMSGVVFHVAKYVEFSKHQALENMKHNILSAIEPGLCPFLLETPAGQGTEVLVEYLEFLYFCADISQKVGYGFGICLDTQHVFAAGYEPYQYLKYCVEIHAPVGLIHYNDSRVPFNSRKDRHAALGGLIPWFFMERVAKLAASQNIAMITEFYTA